MFARDKQLEKSTVGFGFERTRVCILSCLKGSLNSFRVIKKTHLGLILRAFAHLAAKCDDNTGDPINLSS